MRYSTSLIALILGLGVIAASPLLNRIEPFSAGAAFAKESDSHGGSGDHGGGSGEHGGSGGHGSGHHDGSSSGDDDGTADQGGDNDDDSVDTGDDDGTADQGGANDDDLPGDDSADLGRLRRNALKAAQNKR